MSMSTEIKLVVLTTVIVICGLFVGMILKMEKEHNAEQKKKEADKLKENNLIK